MNLSSKVVVNSSASGGETLTVTCFTCGMPSSKEWAQKTRSRPSTSTKAFFPFLLQMIPPHGAILTEDGSTYLCAFCHASLESQWNNHEMQPNSLPPHNRKYFVHKFVCAVCSVETYRKRVRALPFQEFPFLVNKRQPGSLTLGNNPLAVVCLDCSETLWAQSAEYDRWGLPVHKRHFNWMARPPPPEDSVEATVARLPSGETQLPRCPPTEPLIPSKYYLPTSQPEPIAPVKAKAKTNKEASQVCSSGRSVGRSPGMEQQSSSTGRKVSITTASTPVIDTMPTAPSQPPIVTVAPMSSYNTLTSIRKESMSVPPNLTSTYPKYEGIPQPCGIQPPLGPPPLYPRSSLFPSQSTNFSTFPWAGRESSYGEHFPYSPIPNTVESLTPSSSSWSWLQSPSPDLIRYQSFMSSFQNRGYGDIYLNPSQSMYGSSPPPSLPVSSGGPSSTPYLSPYRLRTSPSDPQYTNTVSVSSSTMGSSMPANMTVNTSSSYDTTPMVPIPASSEFKSDTNGSSINSANAVDNSQDLSQNETKIDKNVAEVTAARNTSKASKLSSSSYNTAPALKVPPKKNYSSKKGASNDSGSKPSGSNSPPQGSSRTTPYCKTEERERTIISSATMKDRSEGYVGKKWQWQSHIRNSNANPAKENSSEETEPMDCSLKSENSPGQDDCETSNGMEADCAIDLSVSSVGKSSQQNEETTVGIETATLGNYGGSSNKFMIAYLCKSETISPPLSSNEDAASKDTEVPVIDMMKEKESLSGRSSVIVSTTNKSDGSRDSFTNNCANSDVPDHCNEITDRDDVDKTVNNDGNIDFVGILQKTQTADSTSTTISIPDATGVQNEGSSTHSVHCGQSSDLTSHDASKETQKSEVEEEKDSKALENTLEQEKCVQETIAEFMKKKKEERKILALKEKEQTSFLAELGLITPNQKSEIELNILISRCEHKTLPPLKMRAESPPKVKLREEFEGQLLQVAFDDPSLKQNVHDPSKAMFMETLGLKLASKSDKNRRESEWRLVLTERIMREKRDSRLRGTKRPWDSYSDISNLLTPATKSSRSNPSILESLSLTMPPELVVNTSTGCHTGSSDLLTTVDNREVEKDSNTSNAIKNGMSIIYPKYIPSYVQSSLGKSGDEKDQLKGKISSILNVPIISGSSHSLPIAAGDTPPEPIMLSDVNDTTDPLPTGSQSLLLSCGSILKVPVVTPGMVGNVSRRGSFTSCHTDDTDDLLSSSDETDELIPQANIKQESTITVKTEFDGCENEQVDSIRKSCTENWRKTQEDIEILVASSTGLENSKYKLTEAAENLKKLRKCLKMHQSEVKATEKVLKMKEKQIFKQLRALGRNKNTHVQRNTSKGLGKE